MKFVVCVRVGLTQGTVNNQNGAWRGVLGSGFWPVMEDVCAGGGVRVVGGGARCAWLRGVYFENRLR